MDFEGIIYDENTERPYIVRRAFKVRQTKSIEMYYEVIYFDGSLRVLVKAYDKMMDNFIYIGHYFSGSELDLIYERFNNRVKNNVIWWQDSEIKK